MQITDELQEQYRRDGFILLKNYFSAGALQRIIAEADASIERIYGVSDEPPTYERAAITMGLDAPLLSSALEQPALYKAAFQLYGGEMLGFAAYVASHVGDTGWHADTLRGAARGIRLAFYLKPTTRDRGALRFIPGSHLEPLHTVASAACSDGGDPAAAGLTVVACETEPGDMVVFDRSVLHGSFGGWPDRRVINILYFEDPGEDAAEGLRTSESIADAMACIQAKCRDGQEIYTDHWLANRDRNPLRAKWIKRLLAIGVLTGNAEGKAPVGPSSEGLPSEHVNTLKESLPADWAFVASSHPPGTLRLTMQLDDAPLIVFVRLVTAPHQRALELGGLAWGYNTPGGTSLQGHRMEEFLGLCRNLEVSLGEVFRTILGA